MTGWLNSGRLGVRWGVDSQVCSDVMTLLAMAVPFMNYSRGMRARTWEQECCQPPKLNVSDCPAAPKQWRSLEVRSVTVPSQTGHTVYGGGH